MRYFIFLLFPLSLFSQRTRDLDDRFMNISVQAGPIPGLYTGVTQRISFGKSDIGLLYDPLNDEWLAQWRLSGGYVFFRKGLPEHSIYAFMPMLNFNLNQMGYNTPFGMEYMYREILSCRFDVYQDGVYPTVSINFAYLIDKTIQSKRNLYNK